VLKPDPIFAAVEDILASDTDAISNHEDGANPSGEISADNAGTAKPPRVILMCPQGETFTQKKAEELSQEDHLVFICGHYEGYDERIREFLVTDELSVGDYVLTGGELPAMVVIDSVVRLLPGVLGNETSAVTDSFSTGLLEYPHYTRPAEFRGWKVPDILLSGHHANIDVWRREQALKRTWERRPELLDKLELSKQDRAYLDKLQREAGTS
jgi:tRNA (guanine37-N1)-methyltransferase